MPKRFFTTLIAYVVTACGPIYSTDYEFIPPKSGGKSCIEDCRYYEDLCKRDMRYSKDNCEYDNERLMEECNNRILREKNRNPKWHECGRQITCDYPESRCEENYRNCYRSCGGQVKEIKTCVMNCPESKAP